MCRWHDKWVRALWEWLWVDTKTTALTALTGVVAGDLMRHALCDTGSAIGYSKTNYRRKSSIRWNSITCVIPFRLYMPSVSVLCCAVNYSLLLPTQNIRLVLMGRWAGEYGLPALWSPMVWVNRLDCSVPWKTACNKDKSLEKRCTVEWSWLSNWQLWNSNVCIFLERGVWKFEEKKNMEECRVSCVQYAYLTRTWRRKRYSDLTQIISEGPLYVHSTVNSSYHREELWLWALFSKYVMIWEWK